MTTETVTVPKRLISRLLETIITGMRRGNTPLTEVAAACSAAFTDPGAHTAGPDDPWTLPADVAWWLHAGSDALGVYDLDECAAATYDHPAIVAETEVEHAMAAQAPITTAALDAARTAEIESWGDATQCAPAEVLLTVAAGDNP